MQILVTGASGFIGSALLSRLLAVEQDAIGVGRRQRSRTNYRALPSLADAPSASVIFHLAQRSQRDAPEYTTAVGSETLLRDVETLLTKADRVIFASSAAVYGDGSPNAHTTDEPLLADNPYAKAKLACESAVLRRGGVVARLSNVYGPGMATENVVSTILRQIPGEGALTVRDASPQRDYLWIDDAVDGLMACMNYGAGGIFNIASGVVHSVGAVAQCALSLAGAGHRQVRSTAQSITKSILRVDVSQSHRILGWRAATTLETGLRHLLKHPTQAFS